jgi:hypothetical protein
MCMAVHLAQDNMLCSSASELPRLEADRNGCSPLYTRIRIQPETSFVEPGKRLCRTSGVRGHVFTEGALSLCVGLLTRANGLF